MKEAVWISCGDLYGEGEDMLGEKMWIRQLKS
jgi:hypothetical protein